MSTTTPSQNPIESARAKLIERLSLLVTPRPIRVFPGPSDFQAIAGCIKEAAEIFDDYIAALGREIEDNAPYEVDARAFDKVATSAVGDAVYVCETVAERLIEDREAA
jgi:hypothetical protein